MRIWFLTSMSLSLGPTPGGDVPALDRGVSLVLDRGANPVPSLPPGNPAPGPGGLAPGPAPENLVAVLLVASPGLAPTTGSLDPRVAPR